MKRAPAIVALTAVLLAAPLAAAAELRPSWECLPERTAMMVRLPQAREFFETLKERTKFGATILGGQRLEGMWKPLVDALRREGVGGQLGKLDGFEESLAKHGLEKSDLEAVFKGELGFGVVVQRRKEGRAPLQMLLAWLEPGEGPAGRMLAAIKQIVEEQQAEGDAAPKRFDLEMAGHEVVWIRSPAMVLDVGGLQGGADEDDIGAGVAALQERIKDAKRVQAGVSHSFVTRIGGRLLLGQTMPAIPPVVGGPAAAADRDWDAESGTEDAKLIFLRFLAAHATNGVAPLADILGMPGVRAALPEGLTLVDVVVDPRAFVAAFGGEGKEAEEVARRLDGVGLGDVGPFVWRQSFDGGLYHNGMFLSMPGPRRGLMQILDQPCDACEPPALATSEAVSLVQISLDLGKACQTVREVMVAVGGEEAGNMFTAAEMQAQGWLGLELPKFLSSLGTRHWIIDYPPRIAEAVAAGREAGGQGLNIGEANRGAFVWQVTDEAPFLKILQRLAPLAGGEVKEEQGFRGVRIPNGPAISVGMNHLVVAIGADSLERTLAGIRNPPAGEASLREGDVMRRGAKLLPLDPARMFAVGDASWTGGALGTFREIAANMEPDDVPEDQRGFFRGIKAALPTAAEMEGVFGVSVSTVRMTDEGLVLRSAWEMPAP